MLIKSGRSILTPHSPPESHRAVCGSNFAKIRPHFLDGNCLHKWCKAPLGVKKKSRITVYEFISQHRSTVTERKEKKREFMVVGRKRCVVCLFFFFQVLSQSYAATRQQQAMIKLWQRQEVEVGGIQVIGMSGEKQKSGQGLRRHLDLGKWSCSNRRWRRWCLCTCKR